jgi:glutathione S-transferase
VWIDHADRTAVERVSGQGSVPVIEDSGTVVASSMEIVRHLEERGAPGGVRVAALAAEMAVAPDRSRRCSRVASTCSATTSRPRTAPRLRS